MSKKFDYDLVVIGSGPAGSAGALLAAGAGLKVAIVEADKWGGSALNYRDIPQAAVFGASHLLAEAVNGARFGLSSASLRYNYPTLMNWKDVAKRRAGANSKKVLEEAGVTCLHGYAHFLSPYEISVGRERVSGAKFLVATGAAVKDTGIKGLEGMDFLTPNSALDIPRPPKTLFVVGAGSTGCELAQCFAELGSKVLIADITGRLLPREDEETGQLMDMIFNDRLGIKVLTQSKVISLGWDSLSKKVFFMRGGQEKFVRVDAVLLATGSTPNIDMGLENAGIKYNKDGIRVDKTMQTSAKHIFAAGDIIGGDSSAERAAYEAGLAISNMIYKTKNMASYTGLVRMTNTFPAVAQVGVTEDDCIKRDRKIRKVLVPVGVVQASNTRDFRDGFVKLITDRTGKIIGGTVVAPEADVVVQELATAVRYEMSASEIAAVPHVAGGWGEVVRIAARRLAK